MTRYRTIVADPPWVGDWWPHGSRQAGASSGCNRIYPATLPTYGLMPFADICALPVSDLAADDAHLYLWVPDKHLVEGNAARLARAWGFEPGRLIVWHKRNMGLGKFPRPAHEAVLLCSRGTLAYGVSDVPSVQAWKQPYDGGRKIHSAKPDGFLDLVERASPGPYLELFARRQRLGWDTWGNEALNHVDLGDTA